MKKLDTNPTEFWTLVTLGAIACAGVWSDIYWLVLPFLMYFSGIFLNKLNETDVKK